MAGADPRALAFVVAAAILTVIFIYVENRQAEPILPMGLFRNGIFTISNIYGFIMGLAMFGGIIFIPIYFQGVLGFSATRSGFAMMPMMVGVLSMSIGSGQAITRTGKYKIFPIVGAVIVTTGLLLLSTIKADTPYWHLAIYILIFGMGLGFTMQTTMVAVQNAVPMRDMGVATSAVTFTRNLGGAVGTALFGAILNTRLSTHLESAMSGMNLPAGAADASSVGANNISAMQALEEPMRSVVLGAFTNAMTDVFLVAVPFVVVAFIVALFLREIPLRTAADHANEASIAAMH